MMAQSCLGGQLSELGILYLVMSRGTWIGLAFDLNNALVVQVPLYVLFPPLLPRH